jgi:hypothetical protein
MAKKHSASARNVDGYENTGHTEMHPVKFELSEDEILRYGQQYARNLRVAIPETKIRYRDAIEPLEERLSNLRADSDYIIGELAADPDAETGYINEQPKPEHAHELARVLSEIRGTEGEIQSLKLESKVSLQKLELENEILSLRINLGYEMREVTCSWWVDWANGFKRLIRLDTGEVVLQKGLSPEERQMSLLDFEITEEMRMEVEA